MTVKTRIIRIGNSQGIRIPKLLMEQSGITGEVELEIEDNAIRIRAAEDPRRGWADAFESMAQHGDDAMIDPELPDTDWDREEWQ
ncbi:MAG: AbrB/MazE/SpoVT family DNA-binding domain-containing protein [Bacteroidetes bacterium CG12_big_fil_rev_8_21_14_0_65_60_17]|nr:MAG: AbrB/MazE/SpoVT family DNA-binding domain-containing protein [Bacteroidetes bacterium CG12_big_fil_rev_8_21_14_0_65_60_17]